MGTHILKREETFLHDGIDNLAFAQGRDKIDMLLVMTLMLVCMRWLMGDKIKFCLSFHDEVRYIVKDEHADQAVLAMHVTNLLTRSFCVSRLGVQDLPSSVAFFTSVEIDRILRKDAENDCKTPSNPHGFSNGYGIQFGESVDIYEAIRRAGNDLTNYVQ